MDQGSQDGTGPPPPDTPRKAGELKRRMSTAVILDTSSPLLTPKGGTAPPGHAPSGPQPPTNTSENTAIPAPQAPLPFEPPQATSQFHWQFEQFGRPLHRPLQTQLGQPGAVAGGQSLGQGPRPTQLTSSPAAEAPTPFPPLNYSPSLLLMPFSGRRDMVPAGPETFASVVDSPPLLPMPFSGRRDTGPVGPSAWPSSFAAPSPSAGQSAQPSAEPSGPDRRYVCDRCGHCCSSAGGLAMHKRAYPYCGDVGSVEPSAGPSSSAVSSHTAQPSDADDRPPHVCDICEYRCLSAGGLASHKQSQHYRGDVGSVEPSAGVDVRPHVCGFCGHSCATAAGLASHERGHRYRGEVGSVEPSAGPSTFTVSSHAAQPSDADDRPHVCGTCGHSCATGAGLASHEKTHWSPGLRCRKCNIPIRSLDHMKVWQVEKTLRKGHADAKFFFGTGAYAVLLMR
jgi:hypothetical protein